MAILYEIGNGGGGGMLPHFLITSEAGATITITTPTGTTISPISTGSGTWECDVDEYGTYTINSLLLGVTVTTTVVVDMVKRYEAVLMHYSESVVVTYPSGATCSISDGGSENYTATTNPQTFVLHQENTTYTISVTLDGQTKTQTVTTGSSGGSQSFTIKYGTINVSLENDFIGETVSCTNGVITMTKTVTSTSMVFRPPYTDTWTVSLTYSGDTYTKQAVVSDLDTPVSVALLYYYENIVVTFPAGATCTCSDLASETYTADTNPMTFIVHQENTTYTISVTLDGQTKTTTAATQSTMGRSQSVTVEFGTINVAVANEFLNEVVTCTDGARTITKTATTANLVFRPPYTGTWTISAVYSGTTYSRQAVVSNLSTPVSVSLALAAPMYPFETATDQQLIDILDSYYAGDYDASDIATLKNTYFPIGAKRTIHLSQMAATGVSESHFDSAGADYQFVIIGHEHDDLETAINGKTKAFLTLQQDRILYSDTTTEESTSYDTAHGMGYMNSSNTNAGGWTSCARRTWCNDVYYNALPSNIKSKVKTVKKLTSAGSQSSTINTDNDKAFLLSEIEIFGTITQSKSGEGSQYPYFTTTSNRYKKPIYTGYQSAYWWERSPHGSSTRYFCRVNMDGTASNYGASNTRGLAPAFCL